MRSEYDGRRRTEDGSASSSGIRPRSENEEAMAIQISIVVPTYKRADLLKSCLTALLAQDFDPTAYEIIVADDAGCNSTRQLVASLADCDAPGCRKPCLRYMPVTGAHGPAAARNLG